ncbi:MAG: hypothetical protein U0M02_11445 [Acutalibacteraceae bacterium]|nr:hypothetical protein [Acutalibacteraceae bacterium]
MKNNNYRNEYIRVMEKVDVEESVKQQIIRNCARYSTLNKIRAGKYKLIAVKKEKTAEKV